MTCNFFLSCLRLGVLVVTVGITGLIQGCGTTPMADPRITAAADYGAYPVDYKEIVKRYIDPTLKDAESARYEFGPEPTKGYTRHAIIPDGAGPAEFGYIVYVVVNAKNSYGGYTGGSLYRLLIRNGRVIRRIQPNSLLPEPWYQP